MGTGLKRCEFCGLQCGKSLQLTDKLTDFQGTSLTILEALEIFNENLLIPFKEHTKEQGQVCAECASTLRNCYLFTRQILIAQGALPSLDGSLSSDKAKSQETVRARNVPMKEPQKNLKKSAHQREADKYSRSYKCAECPHCFGSFRQLRIHEATHELDSISICKFCCSLQADPRALEKHQQEQHADAQYICLMCSKHYKLKGHLLKHTESVHERHQLIYYCCLCPRQMQLRMYDSKLALQQHFQAEHLETTVRSLDGYVSNGMNEEFLDEFLQVPTQTEENVQIDMNEEFLDEFLLQNFSEHSFRLSEWEALDLNFPDMLHLNGTQERSGDGSKAAAYKCSHCSEKFANQKTLFVHLTQQHALKLLICNKCDEGFEKMEDLWQHKAKHRLQDKLDQSERNQCKICDKTLTTSAALNYHIKTHSGPELRMHICPYCNKPFKTYQNLKQHLRIVHIQQRKHVCLLCDKQFATLDHLKKHVLSQHQNERKHVCPVCAKRFTQNCHLKQHLAIHMTGKNIYCKICNSTFWRKVDLQRHSLVRHQQSAY